MGLCLLIERLWGQVDTAGPDDGPRLRIDPDLGEVGRVIQRLQDARPSLSREVNITGCGVAEQQPEHVICDHRCPPRTRSPVMTDMYVPGDSLLGHPEWWSITLFRAPLEHADGPADACGLPPALTGPASRRGRQP
jgi:hypothetical protein